MDGGDVTLRVTLESLRDHTYLAFQAWCACTAAREAQRVMVAGQCVSLAPGELVFTKPAAIEALGTSDHHVRRCLELALQRGDLGLVQQCGRRFAVLALQGGLLQNLRPNLLQESPRNFSYDGQFGASLLAESPTVSPTESPTELFDGSAAGADLPQNLRQKSPQNASLGADFRLAPPVKSPTESPTGAGQEEVLREEELSGRTAKSKSKANFLPPEAIAAAQQLARLILVNNPANTQLVPQKRKATILRWADDLEKLNRLDGASWRQIDWMIRWTQHDPFWSTNILSGAKLREKWDQLVLKAVPRRPGPGGGGGTSRGKATITELVQAQLERLRAKKQEEGHGHGGSNPDGGPSLLALPLGPRR